MSTRRPPPPYDRIARFYNEHWSGMLIDRIVPVLDKLLISKLPLGSTVLDLCCGTGQLAKWLTKKEFQVIGIDMAEAMLTFAKENAPKARFIAADARSFQVEKPVRAVLSTFDSLNHIMNPDELTEVFKCCHAALVPGGDLLFDLNMEKGFLHRWKGSYGIAESDYVFIVQPSYLAETKTAESKMTTFTRQNDHWIREDLRFDQKCYDTKEILACLKAAGFSDIKTFDAAADLGLTSTGPKSDLGRLFFLTKK